MVLWLAVLILFPGCLATLNLNDEIADIRSENDGVGLVAWSVYEKGLFCTMGVSGERILGSGEPFVISGESRHHLGSVTKSMTATLLAILIDQGDIPSWDSTLGSVLPMAVDTEYEDVTLRQLAAMRAGIRNDLDQWKYKRITSDVREQRRLATKDALEAEPVNTPGTAFFYTNFGFIAIGHILEYVADTTWENLIATKLFAPLGVDLGTDPRDFTGAPDNDHDPWGHIQRDERRVPCNPDTHTNSCDNALVFQPAGSFSGPVSAMAKYFAWHLSCHNGNHNDVLLPQEACREIHKNVDGGPYGYGWYCRERSWAGGKACSHQGTNTLNFYNAWLALGEEEHVSRAYVAFANERYAFRMTDDAVWTTIQARFDSTCTELPDPWPIPATPAPTTPAPNAPPPTPAPSLDMSFSMLLDGGTELLDEDKLMEFGEQFDDEDLLIEFGREHELLRRI